MFSSIAAHFDLTISSTTFLLLSVILTSVFSVVSGHSFIDSALLQSQSVPGRQSPEHLPPANLLPLHGGRVAALVELLGMSGHASGKTPHGGAGGGVETGVGVEVHTSVVRAVEVTCADT